MITKKDLIVFNDLLKLNRDKKLDKLREKIKLLLKGIELQEELNKNTDELQKFQEKKN